MKSPEEMKIRAAEEVAQEFPSESQAMELVRRLAEYGVKICAPRGIRESTLEDRLKYKAMYLRIQEFEKNTGHPYTAMVAFVDINEDESW